LQNDGVKIKPQNRGKRKGRQTKKKKKKKKEMKRNKGCGRLS
jgi:hypothetical protein